MLLCVTSLFFVAFEVISNNHGQELRMLNTRANCRIFAGYSPGWGWPPCGLEFLTIRTVAIPGSTRANRHFVYVMLYLILNVVIMVNCLVSGHGCEIALVQGSGFTFYSYLPSSHWQINGRVMARNIKWNPHAHGNDGAARPQAHTWCHQGKKVRACARVVPL